jgi:hypothetical protein
MKVGHLRSRIRALTLAKDCVSAERDNCISFLHSVQKDHLGHRWKETTILPHDGVQRIALSAHGRVMLDSSYLPGDGQDSCYEQYCTSPVAASFFVFEKVAAIRAEKVNTRSHPQHARNYWAENENDRLGAVVMRYSITWSDRK